MAEYSVDDREYPEGELRAEIERLTADANRYALIRDHLAQMHSPNMGGQHGWRFRCGWPALRGISFDAAIDAAIVAVELARGD